MKNRDLRINVGPLRDPPIDRLRVEVVERKGLEDGTLSQIKDARSTIQQQSVLTWKMRDQDGQCQCS